MPPFGGNHDVRRTNVGGLEDAEEARLALFQGAYVADDQRGSLSGSIEVRIAPRVARRVAMEGRAELFRRSPSGDQRLTTQFPRKGLRPGVQPGPLFCEFSPPCRWPPRSGQATQAW